MRWQPELIPECGLTKSSIVICIVVCSDVLYLSKILITVNWISRHINMQDVVEVDELAVDALYLTQMDV